MVLSPALWSGKHLTPACWPLPSLLVLQVLSILTRSAGVFGVGSATQTHPPFIARSRICRVPVSLRHELVEEGPEGVSPVGGSRLQDKRVELDSRTTGLGFRCEKELALQR